MFSDSNKSLRTLSNCSSPSRQHILSNNILLKSLSLFQRQGITKRHRLFSDSNKSSRTLSDCSSPSRQHILSDKILLKSLSLFQQQVIAKSHRLFSNRLSQNRQARIQRFNIAKSQGNYFASFDRQIAIASLAIKEHKVAESIQR